MTNWKMKIPRERGRYYKDVWLELADGGSDEWLYVCRYGLTYIFISITDVVGTCGREAPYLLDATVSVVDILTASEEAIRWALSYVGYDKDLDLKDETDRLCLAEALHAAGTKGVLWSGSAGKVNKAFDPPQGTHPAFRKIRSDARKFAETLFDCELRESLLDSTVVNKIGETAHESMQGTEGMWHALRRLRDSDEATPEQKLVLGLYARATHTLGAGPVPEDLREAK